MAAFEILVGTPGVRNLIREGKTRQMRNSVATGQRDGMSTLESCLSDLVAEGVVDYEAAMARSVYPKEVRPRPVVEVPTRRFRRAGPSES